MSKDRHNHEGWRSQTQWHEVTLEVLGSLLVFVAITVLLIFATIAIFGNTEEPVASTTTTILEERVARVVDGDTVEMASGDFVRLIGIDTPERGECGFTEATEALKALVLDETVTLTEGAQDDTDRYGRLLRYVDVGATDSGLTLIEEGYGIARYDSRDGYGPHDRENVYIEADENSEPAVVCEATTTTSHDS